MTDEQIKKIAEEYIAYKYPKSYKEMKPYALKNAIKVISEAFEWLDKNYNIKLIKDELDTTYENPDNSKESWYKKR